MLEASDFKYKLMDNDGYCLYNCLLPYSKHKDVKLLKQELLDYIIDNWNNVSEFASITYSELVSMEHDYNWENVEQYIIYTSEQATEDFCQEQIKKMFKLIYTLDSDLSTKELKILLKKMYQENLDFLKTTLTPKDIGTIWAGLPEIIAFSAIYKHQINIYKLIKIDSKGHTKEARILLGNPPKDSKLELIASYGNNENIIKLLYRNGNHYDLITAK